MKVVIDDKIPFVRGILESCAQVVYMQGAKFAKENVADADALLIRTRTRCDACLLNDTKVRFIATATIGFDHIDSSYCDNNGIFWTNAPGCNSSSVAQYFASAILNFASERNMALKGRTVGIVGVGNVGSKIAKLAEAIGMKVLLNDPPRERIEGKCKFVPLETILAESDIITLHVPLNLTGDDRTFHMADSDFFGRMKKKPLFINSSRGEVADTGALKDAIRSGRISSAVIDVWENEPDINLELLALAKFATPHIAGYSTDGKANGTAMSVQALSRHFSLGLDDWFPKNVPIPQNPKIIIDCHGKSLQDILLEAVNVSYDINADTDRLRKSPETFEKQRGDYPLRREFPAYSIELHNASEEANELLKTLGFNIQL